MCMGIRLYGYFPSLKENKIGEEKLKEKSVKCLLKNIKKNKSSQRAKLGATLPSEFNRRLLRFNCPEGDAARCHQGTTAKFCNCTLFTKGLEVGDLSRHFLYHIR